MGIPSDIRGQHFGKLVAIRPTAERRHNSVVWECRCSCGGTALTPLHFLTGHHTVSCGQCRTGVAKGEKYGWVTLLEPAYKSVNGRVLWRCQCDCGRTFLCWPGYLKNGRVRHCGCLGGVADG